MAHVLGLINCHGQRGTAGQGAEATYLLVVGHLICNRNVVKTILRKNPSPAHGGDADPVYRAPCSQLFMRQRWAAVRRDVRPHLGLPMTKEGMKGLDILL